MKRKQQTKYWHNFQSRYSQYSKVPNKREGGSKLQFWHIYHPFQFMNTVNTLPLPPTPNLRFSMKRPSPTLLQNLLFYGSNSKKLAWNTISNLFWAGVSICNPYELQKAERNGFWVFQGVENWSIGSKWVKWMDQDIAHFSLLRDPLDLWFQIKIPTLLDSYLLLPPTIKNLHKSNSDAYLWSEGHLPILFSFLYTQLLILALLLMTSKNASMTFVLFFNFFCFLFLFSTFLSQISLFNSFVSGRNQKIKS